MAEEFDVEWQMELASRNSKADCDLPVVWQDDKPAPTGARGGVFALRRTMACACVLF